jgi:hypothetical protein
MNGLTTTGTAVIEPLADLSWKVAAVADLNYDGKPDIVWRNIANGQNAVWYMNGIIRTGTGPVNPTVPDQAWTVAGTGDFNNDGRADLIWRNLATGANIVWYMNGASLSTTVSIDPLADVGWKIGGGQSEYTMPLIGDTINGTKPDIVWRNIQTGENKIWHTNGSNRTEQALPAETDLTWTIVGRGDFNNDGKPDILWRNTTTGENRIWLMDVATPTATVNLTTVADVNMKIAGVGDFNSDGKPDIVWRNYTTGANSVWYMDGVRKMGDGTMQPVSDTNWKIVGVGDFNNDGRPDILWRNVSSGGYNAVWLMNGVAQVGAGSLPSVPDQSWKVGNLSDFNGDGRLDIFWRNIANGSNTIWYMSGLNVLGYGNTFNLDQNWRIGGGQSD